MYGVEIAWWLPDLLLPVRCVACGRLLEGRSRWPLCDGCSASLHAAVLKHEAGNLCARCGAVLRAEHGLCMRCRTTVDAFDSVWSLWRYRGAAKEAILAFKGGSRRSLATYFADFVADWIVKEHPGLPVVPVPPRQDKYRVTGRDQVEDIAVALEKRHGIRVWRALVRKGTTEQKKLNREQRKLNLAHAIIMRDGTVAGQDIVLLDDVMTTGATLSACAGALKNGGIRTVHAITLASD